MFEIESKKPDEITITTKKTSVTVNVAQSEVDGNLAVGKIQGPGEFEIGDVTLRGIDVEGSVIYDIDVNEVKIAIIGGCEKGLDELGMVNILCTSSVRAIREIEPKIVVAMGNIDGMVTDLKLSARTEKKLKVKNADSLPVTLEVVALT